MNPYFVWLENNSFRRKTIRAASLVYLSMYLPEANNPEMELRIRIGKVIEISHGMAPIVL